MYGWIWRHLPGPTPARAALSLLLVAAVVVVLFGWGFDHLAQYVPFNNGTVST